MADRSDATPAPEEPGGEADWVPLSDAAAIAGCPEHWLMDRCQDGRLPSRPGPGSGVLVPLATAQALAAGQISD